MKRGFYIGTNIHGRGIKHITYFESRAKFEQYAEEAQCIEGKDSVVRRSASIQEICDYLYDSGIGSGARDHRRVSRKEAVEHIKNGAEAIDCWNLRERQA